MVFFVTKLISLVILPPVMAQDEPSISFRNTTLSIYPEYDDLLQLGYPSVLVMFDGEIVTDNPSSLIHFLVPSNAQMYSAGSGPRSQYIVGGSLNISSSNLTGWNEVSFIPSSKYFVVEYYAPVSGNPDRMLPFDFRTLYPVTGLRVVVQEPRRSTDFRVSPEGGTSTDGEGFRVHTYNLANVNPDEPVLFDISYSKRDTTPSTSAGTSSNTTMILIVTGVIAALVITFFIISGSRTKTHQTATRQIRRQAVRAEQRGKGKTKYCPNCGTPVQSGDRFCPDCGGKLG